jgi:hypothetical protein
MLESFTIETFADRIGERFGIAADDGGLEAELVEATALTALSGKALETPGDRAPFSLVFLGPGDPVLPQAIYRFEHDELGAFEIFVVPIGRDETGVRYEAVFT